MAISSPDSDNAAAKKAGKWVVDNGKSGRCNVAAEAAPGAARD